MNINALTNVLIKTLKYNYMKEEIGEALHGRKWIYSCLHACACACAHACGICACTQHLLVYVCLHGMPISCLLVVCIYKMFHHMKRVHYFIATKQDLRRC